MLVVKTATRSDLGRLRERNEDSCGEFEPESGQQLLVVADGMGGHRAGDTASRIAVETIAEKMQAPSTEPLEARLRHAFEAASERIHTMASRDSSLAGMGTTGVALLLDPGGNSLVAHVGDSRAYRMRGKRLEALTADHSVVAELERRGMMTRQEAAVHPRRNELLRSLGVEPRVEVEVSPVSVEPGDRFLLCSDGLTGVVPNEDIAAVLDREDPEEAVRTLIDLANNRGGPDNITVQIAIVKGDVA